MTDRNLRQATRALIVDPEHHVLLVRFEFPTRTAWAMPGGGLDDGESHTDGLRRELREELGLLDFTIGPHIWSREHIIPMPTGHDGQRDQIYAVHTERFDPEPDIGWEQLRAEAVHEIRWWSIGDVNTATETVFLPARFPELLSQYLQEGPPPSPIETGA